MANVYEVITNRIIESLERGTVPWHQPWGAESHPKNLISGKEYRGINAFLLSTTGYESPFWLTYKQAKDRGGNVKRGEKGYPCIYWNWFEKEDRETRQPRKLPFLRYYTLFNVTQCERVAYPIIQVPRTPFSSIEMCERIVREMPNPPRIEDWKERAFYRPSDDLVGMPKRERFDRPADYYSMLFHELTHSTGHSSRLSRPGIMESIIFASTRYSKEELVAEMGAAFLCGHAGIEKMTTEDSASYIASWLARLRNDTRLVVHAAAQAQKAADYILGKQKGGEDEMQDVQQGAAGGSECI